MTCSDEELKARRRQARELGLIDGACYAWFPGNFHYASIYMPTLVAYVEVDNYGPFTTMREAVSMLILLGGGPK